MENLKLSIFKFLGFSFLIFCLLPLNSIFAEMPPAQSPQQAVVPQAAKPIAEVQNVVIEGLGNSSNVTLDFKEADIRNVLKIISYKSGVNIVTTPDVMGNVTIRLVDVPWDRALDVILKTYGFGYERKGNIISVAPIDKLTSLKKQEVELAEVQPTIAEVFQLKYVDAQDVKKAIDPQLSARGKATALEMTGQAGWEFNKVATNSGSTGDSSKLTRQTAPAPGRSRVLIVSDVPPIIEKIKEIVAQIDIMPKQVLIETRIMEVSRDKLIDIGVDWGTGQNGATSTTLTPTPTAKNALGQTLTQTAGNQLGSQVKPAGFNPLATTIAGVYPYNTGMSVLFQKLTGNQFEVLIHALEEDVLTNTLSAPRVLTLNNQEATILVGTKYPILLQNVTGAGNTAITTVTLDYYQDIGIQLNVVPQIGDNGYINMVVHPAVTSYTSTLGTNAYPIIEAREAETRVLMKDGDTIVIGGLLKDMKAKGQTGVPFLSKIPLLGILFSRDTNDTKKIDLLIFISAKIVKEGDFTPQIVSDLQQRVETGALMKDKKKVNKKNKDQVKLKDLLIN
ncbi:MAG: type IV pilus secretin PilQ [Candidatus Omnitrophota bacterium]